MPKRGLRKADGSVKREEIVQIVLVYCHDRVELHCPTPIVGETAIYDLTLDQAEKLARSLLNGVWLSRLADRKIDSPTEN